jgi:hypothetical protein
MTSYLNFQDLVQLIELAHDAVGALDSIATSLESIAKDKEKSDD